MNIETVTSAHFDQLLPLIADYQRFYQAEPDEDRNRAHFSQFLENHSRGVLFLVRHNEQALGFATLYFPFSSVRARSVCLMNDLFTVETARGKGVARALISHCRDYARTYDFPDLQWNTAQDNLVAQRLYDDLEAQQTSWFTYVLQT